MKILIHIGAAMALVAAVALMLCEHLSPPAWGLIVALGCLAGFAGYAADPTRRGAVFTAVIFAVVIAMLHPFLHPTFVGAGDARDYFRMFADFVDQERSGVREIFVGQTAFAFEGTVHTTRTSPMFYHVGALLDLLSFRSLGHLVLEKFTLFAFFSAAGFAFYLCCVRGLGLRPLTAFLIACVYLSAPAVLAPLYFSDMYATFTALPFMPIFLIGVVRLADNLNAPRAWLLLGIGSGGLFWTHPAVAIWVHLAALFCLLLNIRAWSALRPRTLLYAVPIVFVLAYPVLSSFQLGSSLVRDPRAYAAVLRQVYLETPHPWARLFWISGLGDTPNSFKNWSVSWIFGVPVLLAWLIVLVKGWRIRRIWPLLLCAGVMVVLMNGVVLAPAAILWKLVPDVIVRITFNWPLQRFSPIVTCLALICLACVLARLEPSGGPVLRRSVLVTGLLLLAVNVAQAWTVQVVPVAETLSPSLSIESVKSDNIVIPYSNYDFMNRGLDFRYITTGRSDPLSEIRLHDQADYGRVIDIFSMRRPDPPTFVRSLAYQIFNTPICRRITLPAGSLTVLNFENLPPGLPGMLEIRADGVPWDYYLPYNENGGSEAFGTGPHCRKSLLVRNSGSAEKIVEIYYYPPAELQDKEIALGTVTACPVLMRNHYFSFKNLVPLEMDLDAPYPVVVETPRIFLDGYTAQVDGRERPVFKSPQGLVALSVPAGAHEVTIFFKAGTLLKSCYRLSLVAWLYFVGYGAFLLCKSPRPSPV